MRSFAKFCSAVLVFCASTQSLDAQNLDAWFAFVAGHGVVADEGPGKTLVIEKDLDDGLYEFTVRLLVNHNATTPLVAHVSDIWLGAGGSDATVETKDVKTLLNWTIQALDGINGEDPFQGDDPAKLVSNIGEAYSGIFTDVKIFPGALNVPLVEWTFSVTESDAQPGDTININYGIGRSLWAVNQPNPDAKLVVGPNDPIALNDQSVSSLPVITIVNIPEPATAVLLGLGAVVFIRRRRAAGSDGRRVRPEGARK